MRVWSGRSLSISKVSGLRSSTVLKVAIGQVKLIQWFSFETWPGSSRKLDADELSKEEKA